MDNNKKYELLAERETGLPSVMGVFPSTKNFKFEASQIEKSLTDNNEFKLLSFNKIEAEDELSTMSFNAEIEYKETTFNVDLYVLNASDIDLNEYGLANRIDDESIEVAMKQEYFLETSMHFELEPLTSFHLQLKIMSAIVPCTSVVIDFSSFRLLSGKWLSLTANSSIPPSLDYLYVLHCVYDEESEDGNRRYWFHTHGLHRSSSVELEILNFSNGPEEMNALLNMTVKKFISEPVKERESFTIGYDGLGINLCWLRWEEALKELPEDILGGLHNRSEEDPVHSEPSGILFAVEDGNMISPEIYAWTLAKNPIFYITEEETERMSALAKSRFAAFENAFRKAAEKKPEKKSFLKRIFGAKEEETPEWFFLVKLGLTASHADSEGEREHLWYKVLSIDNGKITGELLNQPYWVPGLNEGDVRTYPLDILTDWRINSPDNV